MKVVLAELNVLLVSKMSLFSLLQLAGNWKTLDRVCKKLDQASTGFLTLPEFQSVLQLCNIVLDEDEMYHLMSKYDKDMVGKIKYSKLINKIFKTP